MCDAGDLTQGTGQLEQSGETFLPTTVWSCEICGYARFAPALGVHWRPDAAAEQPPAALPARRAA
jgi:hypothetical protein